MAVSVKDADTFADVQVGHHAVSLTGPVGGLERIICKNPHKEARHDRDGEYLYTHRLSSALLHLYILFQNKTTVHSREYIWCAAAICLVETVVILDDILRPRSGEPEQVVRNDLRNGSLNVR
jgi:hypothetical protein